MNKLFLFYIIVSFCNCINIVPDIILNRRQLITTSMLFYNNNYNHNDNDNDNENGNDNNNALIYNDAISDYNIYFNDQLNQHTCFKLSNLINSYQNNIYKSGKKNIHINLYIQSQGGTLLPTLAIVDEIKKSKVPIWTHIRGYAASAATLISVVGQKRLIYNHSLMMIHNVKTETSVTTYRDIEDSYKTIELFSNTIKNIYLDNSKLSSEQLDFLLDHESWFNSTSALEYGMVDIIY